MTLVLILISIHLSFTYHKILLCPFIQQENNDKESNDKETRTHNKLTGKTNFTHVYLPYALLVIPVGNHFSLEFLMNIEDYTKNEKTFSFN